MNLERRLVNEGWVQGRLGITNGDLMKIRATHAHCDPLTCDVDQVLLVLNWCLEHIQNLEAAS